MRRLYCFTLGFFLLTVKAERDIQGYHTGQTRGITVTKDLLLKKENTIGHGAEAATVENMHRQTAVAVTTKSPGVALSEIRPKPTYERVQITKASPVMASLSTGGFVPRYVQNSLTPTRESLSATRNQPESEIPLISHHEMTVSSSTQAAFVSVMNSTSKPGVNLSGNAMKVSLWPHTLLDNRNQRSTDSITLTSADGGSGVPTLSESHPPVIDDQAVLRNDNDDKRSQGKDENGISNLGGNVYPLGKMQSIIQNDTAKNSMRGHTVTNLFLTCLKDRRASTEESVDLPAPSPDASSDSNNTGGLTLDFNQLTTALSSLHQQPVGKREEILKEEIIYRNIIKPSSFDAREGPVLSFNKSVNHNQNILNNSQIKSFFSDTGTVASGTQSLAEISSQKDTKKQFRHISPSEAFVTERPSSATTLLNHSSNSFYTVRKPKKIGEQKMFGKKVSVEDQQAKLMYFSRNASQSLSTNFRNVFIQNQHLDFSSGSVSNTPVNTAAPQSSEKSVHPGGGDHSAASSPTARMRLIEAHSTPFGFSGPNTMSNSLTGRAVPLISVSKSQTPVKPSSRTKDPISTLLPEDSAINFVSANTKRHLTNRQDSKTFHIANSILKQSAIDPSAPANKPVMKEPQTPAITTRKVVVPEKLFLSELRRNFDDDASMLTLTTMSSKSFSERLTMSELIGTPSKIPQERTFDVSSDYHVVPTHQSSAKHDKDLIRESLIVYNLKMGDKNEQVLTVVAEYENKEIIKVEGKQGEEIKEKKEILDLQEEDESREDEKLESKREGLFRSDMTDSRKQEEIINTRVELNQNTDKEGGQMEEHKAKTNREEGGSTIGEGDVTLRRDKDPRQGEVRDKQGPGGKGVTKINTESPTEALAEEQAESSTKERAEARREETARNEDIKHNREIGGEDMTNVPLGPITHSTELNRSKGHTITNLSCCHSLIKQLGSTEHEGNHLRENTGQIEMKNKPFPCKVTSNHRLLHSTLRSQSTKLSRMTSLPEIPYTQIKTHLSTNGTMLTKRGDMSPLANESTQSTVFKATLSVNAKPKLVPKLSHTFEVSTSKFSDTMNPTTSPLSNAAQTAYPVLNNITKILPLTTQRLAFTAVSPKAQPHFKVDSSTLSISNIYSISDHRHKFSALVLKENSLFQTTNKNEQAERILPANIFKSSVKDPLTSNMIEVHISTTVNPALPQQMYNDSSTRATTATALSSKAHISIGQLQRHRGGSAPQISQSSSSSFDMSSGQPCSFKLSEQTAHSNAPHAPVDDNKQRSVETLMASMSPKAKNDQFPPSSTSPLLNLMLFGSDSLPGTYSLTGLTRSASGEKIVRANSDTENANSGNGHTESFLGTADETNQIEEFDSVQTTVTSADAVTKQMAENRDKKNSPPFITHAIGRSQPHARNSDKFNSLSVIDTEKQAGKNTNENNHDDLFKVNHEANNTMKTTLKYNRRSQTEGYNERSTKLTVFTMQTTHRTGQAVREDFLPVTNDFAIPMLDTNDRNGTTAFIKSSSLPEIPQIKPDDVTTSAISAAKRTEKRHNPSQPQGTMGDNAILVPHNLSSDLKVPIISTQQTADQIMSVTSEFQITTAKANDFVSLAPAASITGAIVSTAAHESALTTSESRQVGIEKSSLAAHAERMAQSNSHVESLSLKEPPATPATGKLTPAVTRKNTTEIQNVEQSEREISAQAIKQSQHAPLRVIAVAPTTHSVQGVRAGLLKATHRAGRARDRAHSTATRLEYSSFKDIKAAQTTKSAFEAKHSLHETFAVHTLYRAGQHKKQALPEKTSISQVIHGPVTDSVPPTGISPTGTVNQTSCSTIVCDKSGETSKTTTGGGEIHRTAAENTYETQAGNIKSDHFKAAHTPATKPENGNCTTDSPVPGKATPQVTNRDYAVLSPATSTSDHDHATADKTVTKNTRVMTDEPSTKTQRALVEADLSVRRGTPVRAQFAEKTTQRHSHKETSKPQETAATEVVLSEPEATVALNIIKSSERTLFTEKNSIIQLNRGATKAEIVEAQNATRSVHAVAKGEMAVQESGHRLLLPETESVLELQRLKHRRRTSPHLYLSGVTEVSDDLCGSGNYTAEMSLNLGRGVEPGDAVPALGNLRVVINLKTNNSRINLEVTSCCLSPTIQPDLTNSTCCLFSRLAAEPAGITLLPSALSTSASFTISLFQMINYSVVYLHCDLSICLRNRPDCERQCLQQRSAFPLEAIGTNLRNRISFGPMLKEVKNSTSPEELDPSDLDLVLVIVSLVAGSSLVTVTLLLMWLAYHRWAIWPVHSAAMPRACCGCLRRGGDLILP